MEKLKGYAVQCKDKKTGEIYYVYSGYRKASIYNAICQNKKKAETYLFEDDYDSPYETRKIVEVEIIVKD